MKFKTQSGYGVTVYPPNNPSGIRIQGDDVYETDDEAEIGHLKGTPGIEEVKSSGHEAKRAENDK